VKFNLCMIGFGNVGRGLVEHLLEQENAMREQYGIEFRLTGVASRRLGFLSDPNGLDLKSLLEGRVPDGKPFDVDRVKPWLAACNANVLFELSSLNPFTGQPATDFLRAALELGAHAITANKGPLVHAYTELNALAISKNLKFRFESATADCVPVYSLFRDALPLARPHGFRGLVNGTTSVILEVLERGGSFEDGVKLAQDRGVAETDPKLDVKGFDAAVKVVAIANVLMGANLKLEDFEITGIARLEPSAVQAAFEAGTPIRLVSSVERVGDTFKASVKPIKLEKSDPFNGLDAMSLALHFQTNVVPGVTVIGHGLNAHSTAYGVLCDFINVARGH
jgi:homoserine dehydrogenase